ncbi:MAG: HAMP domain-containing protein [Streptosporangiales bacterium]|nr:HAMP domain-containing protein [Streptosporangiales bacterium]
MRRPRLLPRRVPRLLPRLLPRRITLRARLTLIHGGLFLLAGVMLLGATYALFDQQIGKGRVVIKGTVTNNPGKDAEGDGAAPKDVERDLKTFAYTDDGVLTGPAAQQWMRDQQRLLHDAAATSLLTQGGIALGLAGGVAIALGWLVTGRALAPLHRVTGSARRIAAAPSADLRVHQRIALRRPDDEVKDLSDAFDTMVERLDRSFAGQRRFVANASHELRTPLTLGRSLVEVAMHRRSASDDVKVLGEQLLLINSRYERLIAGLLTLARSDTDPSERHPVDLGDLAAHVAELLDTAAAEAGVHLSTEPGEAVTSGDALLLERLVHNLVENGVRYNVPGGHVSVITRYGADGRAELEVGNTGPEVGAAEVPGLFEPFWRSASARVATANGAGLGLSIVRSVAQAHGGEVSARPREGGGLVVTVALPSCTDAEGESA